MEAIFVPVVCTQVSIGGQKRVSPFILHTSIDFGNVHGFVQSAVQ